MSLNDALLVERRSQLLARVHLSRREDLLFADVADDIGLDLIVRINSARSFVQCIFGVIIKGTSHELSDTKAASNHIRNRVRQRDKTNDPYPMFPFPVVFFLFSMKDDRGYYAWSTEPMASSKHTPQLRYHERPECDYLDEAAIESMVDRITGWYERAFKAFRSRLTMIAVPLRSVSRA